MDIVRRRYGTQFLFVLFFFSRAKLELCRGGKSGRRGKLPSAVSDHASAGKSRAHGARDNIAHRELERLYASVSVHG